MGAKPTTISGLSGLGDIMLTCYGDLSRNRSVGIRLGRGERLEDIVASSSQVRWSGLVGVRELTGDGAQLVNCFSLARGLILLSACCLAGGRGCGHGRGRGGLVAQVSYAAARPHSRGPSAGWQPDPTRGGAAHHATAPNRGDMSECTGRVGGRGLLRRTECRVCAHAAGMQQ